MIVQLSWFEAGLRAFSSSISLYRAGRIPKSIEHLMIEVPILHMLRGIHGKSNLGVALDLLWHAVGEVIRMWWVGVKLRAQHIWYVKICRMSDRQAHGVIFDETPETAEAEEEFYRAIHGADGP